MAESGYVYILINPSMQGLVKVGRTSRDPADRAAELSAATGVPTPFVVVYSSYFEDSAKAEDLVHALLERGGCRTASNREFFQAPVQSVIDAVLMAKKLLPVTASSVNSDQSKESNKQDERKEPWHDLLEQAKDYYEGRGEVIQDKIKALRLLEQAARLGSTIAWQRLGLMHKMGEGCSADLTAALECYQKGAERGNLFCYWSMAEIFFEGGQFENAQKCWKNVFKSKNLDVHPKGWFGYYYLKAVREHQQPIECRTELLSIKSETLQYMTEQLNSKEKPPAADEASVMGQLIKDLNDDLAVSMIERPSAEVCTDLLRQADKYYAECFRNQKNSKLAIGLYKKAADLGSSLAYYRLGFMYRYAIGGYKDEELALSYFEKGAAMGEAGCCAEVAQLLDTKNPQSANEYWAKYFCSETFRRPPDEDDVIAMRGGNALSYITVRAFQGKKFLEYKEVLSSAKEEILEALRKRMANRNNTRSLMKYYEDIRRQIEENL